LIGAKVWFLMSSFAASTSIRVNFDRMVTPIPIGDEPNGEAGFKIVGVCRFQIHNEFVGTCTIP